MTQPKSPRPAAPISRTARRLQALTWLIAILVVIGVAAFYCRGIGATYAQSQAIRLANRWSISPAIEWLKWAQWLDPDNPESYLLEAHYRRILGRLDLWHKNLKLAKAKGGAQEWIDLEKQINAISMGQLPQDVEFVRSRLVQAGYSNGEISTALVQGYLTAKQSDKAELLLEQWETSDGDTPQLDYAWGYYGIHEGQSAKAEQRLQSALAKQPEHELARRLIAELYDTQKRLQLALEQYGELLHHFPTSPVARIGIAGILRQLVRPKAAKKILQPALELEDCPSGARLEAAQLALDEGHYDEVDQWFAGIRMERVQDYGTLATASVMYGLQGNIIRALRLNRRGEALDASSRRMEDLRTHLLFNPDDQAAAEEFQLRATGRRFQLELGPRVPWEPIFEDISAENAATGPELFAVHCSVCHGGDGQGDGRAAQHVFPRSRNFRLDRFRLVSATNGVPTLGDLERVIRLGMPGTSMPGYETLTQDQRMLLAREVLRLHQQGIRDQFIAMLEEQDEEVDEEEARDVVQSRTTPRNTVHVPEIDDSDIHAAARGRQIYLQQGCDKCHGDRGEGAADSILFDDMDEPTRARDLVHEPFKGGNAPDAVYLRLVTAMPGSPHPATTNLTEAQLTDLVLYVESLAVRPERLLTNYQRESCALAPSYLREYPPQSP